MGNLWAFMFNTNWPRIVINKIIVEHLIFGIMKIISKHFDNLKKSGQYQERLYNKYDHVKLIAFPTVWESGVYTWEVC